MQNTLIKKIAKQGTTILLASHLLDEVEKVCSHVVILRKGIKLYSGRVDQMNASHGFFELNSNENTILKEWISKHAKFDHYKEEDDKIIAFLAHELDAESLNKQLCKDGITLTHLVKRKESLEEQFLQLTNNLNQ